MNLEDIYNHYINPLVTRPHLTWVMERTGVRSYEFIKWENVGAHARARNEDLMRIDVFGTNGYL